MAPEDGLVVCRATTYKRGMTVPESKSTLTARNHHTGSAGRKHLGAHLPTENHSWRLVNEHTLEEITSSQQAKRLCGYPDKWQRARLEQERKAYPEESCRAIGDDKCTEHREDVKCTYKCTDLEDDQCDYTSTGEMMRRSSELDLCGTSAIMSTEAVPNETENDLRTYQIVYRTAPWETVTEWHRQTVETTIKRWLPDCFEWKAQELRIIGSLLPKPPTGMFTKRLTERNAARLYWRTTSQLGRCWRSMNITTNGHRVRATGCKRWCQISRLAYKAMHEDLESTRIWRAQARLNIYGTNDHFMRSLRDRYEVIYDWPSPTAMIPRAEATIHAEKSSPLHPCRLSANMTAEAASKAAIMITDGQGLRSSRGIGKARVLAPLKV